MAVDSDAKAPNLVSLPADWSVAKEGENPPAVDPIIHLTEAARVEGRKLIEAEGKPGLRLGIKGGGCSGLTRSTWTRRATSMSPVGRVAG